MSQSQTFSGTASRNLKYHNIGEGILNIHNPTSQEANTLVVVDRVLEPQTVPHFLEFLGHDRLPSGKRSGRSEVLGGDDFTFFLTPSQEWAPDRLPKQSKSMVDLMMIAIGSHEDQSGLSLVTKPVHAMKSRIWEGISPMSDARWAESRLDDPENHDLAIQHLSNVVATFDYLNMPEIQASLKGTYNKIYNHMKVFNTAFKAVRQNQDQSVIDVPAKWEEFFEDHLSSMCQRAHGWVQRHVTTLQKQVLEAVKNHPHDAELHPAPPPYDAVQWKLTNRFHDLTEISVRADVRIWLPMHGYHGYTPPSADLYVEPDMWSSDVDKRTAAFVNQIKLLSSIDPSFMLANGVLPLNHQLSIYSTCESQRSAQRYTLSKQRGEPMVLGPEPWIAHLSELADPSNPRASELNPHFGLVIYRLTHTQDDREWQEFEKRLDADIRSWTAGQKDAALIDSKWKLHWIDGKDVGIPDGNLDSAIAHFNKFREDEANQKLFDSDFVKSSVFLAVDSASFASYMERLEPKEEKPPATSLNEQKPTSSTQQPAGEVEEQSLDRSRPPNMRFVHAVDVDFDPLNPGEHAEESPNFTGRMRVLGSLVVADLYSMDSAQTQGLFELWPLAMRNPGQIYMGPVVRGEEEAWKMVTALAKPEPAAQPAAQQDWIKAVIDGFTSIKVPTAETGSNAASEAATLAEEDKNSNDAKSKP